MSNYEADRHFYAPPNTLINLDRMRSDARKGQSKGSSTVIHLHPPYDPCEDFGADEHEFYDPEEYVNA